MAKHFKRRKAAPPLPPILHSLECQCEGVWHAYAKLGTVEVCYRLSRLVGGEWAITVRLPFAQRESEVITGWPTLREALAAADADARDGVGIWAELATAA